MSVELTGSKEDPEKRQQPQQPNDDDDDDDDGVLAFTSTMNLESRKKNDGNSQTWQTLAGVAGNVLEWYDFAAFGFFSDIIGDLFFPPQGGHTAIVESFAVFGGAFLMRPIGGLLMGYIGDKFGRKRALEISVFLMAFPTFAMGCLPTYPQVGWVSIVLLVIVRLLQGLSVGGQLMSSLVFTLERYPRRKWGLYGSYVMASANFGTLLGGIVGFTIRESLSRQQLLDWGWRIPFLMGILVSICGIYLRYFCEEESHLNQPSVTTTAAAVAAKAESDNDDGAGDAVTTVTMTPIVLEVPKNPVKLAFAKENRRSLAASSLVPMVWAAGFYTTFVWMAIFMEDLSENPVPRAFGVNSASLFLSVCLLFPVAGVLSDGYGRRITMTIGGVSFGILSPIMLLIIGQGDPVGAFFAQCIMGLSLSFWGAPMMAWLVESFPPESRLTSVAIGYNMAHATVGGIAPALATYLVDTMGGVAPGFLLTVVSILSLIGLHVVAPPPPPDNEIVPRNKPPQAAPEILGDHQIA